MLSPRSGQSQYSRFQCRTLALGLFSMYLLCFLRLVSPTSGAVFSNLAVGFNGSRVHFVDSNGAFLKSPNNTFQLVFRSASGQDTERFYLSIWHPATGTVVWVANRNSPVGFSDPIVFREDGNVALYQSAVEVWSTQTNSSATSMQLQDTGNLLVLNNEGDVLWQSFDHPTDTLVPRQRFSTGFRLVASVSPEDPSEGSYSLLLQQGDVNDLILLATISSEEQAYWSMRTDSRSILPPNATGVPSFAMLEDNSLGLYTDQGTIISRFPVAAQDQGVGMSPRGLALREDGSLQAFYYENRPWADDRFTAPGDSLSCKLPGACGPYGICTDGQCRCSDSFVQVNDANPFQGCRLPDSFGVNLTSCSSSGKSVGPSLVEWLQVTGSGGGVDYFANQFVPPLEVANLSECQRLCAQNCSCTALFYRDGSHRGDCYLLEHVATLQSDPDPERLAFVKVARPPSAGGTSSALTISITCGVVFLLCASCLLVFWTHRKRRADKRRGNRETAEDDVFLDTIPGLPMRFTYKELERCTFSFSQKLGAGGFGSVYEGILPDGSRVAVKKLESMGQGFKEFRAEVATIGSIHHLHLVQLRGFCAEGVHRLLVYEYLANGSLEKSLFEPKKNLSWDTRFDIALGTARGLAYLHEGCREKIIHCDIKPENILLDEHYVAKVSDFGLAKLMNRDLSQVFTTMRGTRGYLAPEWVTNYAITEKSDVFSFGMVLLEIVSGRKNCDPTETSEKWYFPAYAFKQIEIGHITELLDPKLKSQADESLVGLVLRVALWCIQEDVTVRPSMGKVVQMLEGNIKVPLPPASHHCFGGILPKLVDAATGSSSKSVHGFDGFGEYEGIRFSSLSAERLSGPR